MGVTRFWMILSSSPEIARRKYTFQQQTSGCQNQMHQNTNLPSAYQRMEYVFLYCSEYACTYLHVCILEYTYNMIWYDLCISFFPPTQFERLFFDVTSWRTSQVQSGLTWPGTGAQNDLGVAASKLQASRITHPGFWYFFGPWGFVFRWKYLFKRMIFHTKR